MTVKNFAVAARANTPKPKTGPATKPTPFTIGDDTKTKYHLLARNDVNESALATVGTLGLIAIQGGDLAKAGAGVIELLPQLFTAETVSAILNKLKDRDDPFGWDDLAPVLEWAVEELTGRPTTS